MTAARRHSSLSFVSIAVGPLHGSTIGFSDIRNGSFLGTNSEVAIGFRGYSSYMHASIVQVSGNTCLDDISGAKPMRKMFDFRSGARKTPFIHQTHLATSMPLRFDTQGNHALHVQRCGRACPDTGCIDPVRFLHLSAGP